MFELTIPYISIRAVMKEVNVCFFTNFSRRDNEDLVFS